MNFGVLDRFNSSFHSCLSSPQSFFDFSDFLRLLKLPFSPERIGFHYDAEALPPELFSQTHWKPVRHQQGMNFLAGKKQMQDSSRANYFPLGIFKAFFKLRQGKDRTDLRLLPGSIDFQVAHEQKFLAVMNKKNERIRSKEAGGIKQVGVRLTGSHDQLGIGSN